MKAKKIHQKIGRNTTCNSPRGEDLSKTFQIVRSVFDEQIY